MKSEERNINIDLMRVISMIFVIALHTNPRPMMWNGLFRSFYFTFFMVCNSCFFMISGHFNLNKRFCSAFDIMDFYGKRIISILFPFVFGVLFLYLWSTLAAGEKFSFTKLYKVLMGGGDYDHLWYMYCLIGFLLSTPFLSKALSNMGTSELKIVFFICALWSVAEVYLTKNLGVNFRYSGWILEGSAVAFFSGYFCDRVVNNKNKKWFYILGSIGFLITLICYWKVPERFNNPHDASSVAFLLYSIAFYIFFTRDINAEKLCDPIKKLITFAAKHSFMAYLLHWNILAFWSPLYMFKSDHKSVIFMGVVIITFFVSILLAFALDTLFIFPVQRGMRKLLNRIEEKSSQKETDLNGQDSSSNSML